MAQDQARKWLRRGPMLLVPISAVPLCAAVLLLQIIGPLGNPLSLAELESLRTAIQPPRIVGGALIYSAAMLIHFFVCLTSIGLAILVLRNVPNARRFAKAGALLAVAIALLLPLVAIVAGRSVVAINLTYFAVEDLFAATGAVSPLLPGWPFTPIQLWIYIPTLMGIIAVAIMVAAVAAQLSLIADADASGEAKEARLCLVYGHIKQCAYVLSLVLVTSTIAASLYFHMPLKGIDAADKTLAVARGQLANFAGQLTLFWGAVFTLTLISAVGIPLVLVQKEFRAFLESLQPIEIADKTRERLAKAGYLTSGSDQTKLIVSFIAPLAAGPTVSLLQSLLG